MLRYAINIVNYDVGCRGSTFTLAVSSPGGFSVSLPTNTVTLRSSSSSYLSAYVASPSVIADGDYPLTVTIQRASASTSTVSATSYYKVYSTDTATPSLYWPNPADGVTIGGGSYQVVVSASDDHAVEKIELFIDNSYTAATICENIAFECQLAYRWSLHGVHGRHTATFKTHDWMGNVGVLTTTFNVG